MGASTTGTAPQATSMRSGSGERRADDERDGELERRRNPGSRHETRGRSGFDVHAHVAELSGREHVEDEEPYELRAHSHKAVHQRVVEAVPVAPREEDREPQDEPEREERGGGEDGGVGVAVDHELAEVARREQVENEETHNEDSEANPGIGKYLTYEFKHVSSSSGRDDVRRKPRRVVRD